MLMITNRVVRSDTRDAQAFTTRFQPNADTLSLAEVTRHDDADGRGTWTLARVDPEVDDAQLVAALAERLVQRPLLLYVHGNNNTPQTAFRRCRRLGELYPDVEVAGLSWPAEGLSPQGLPGVEGDGPVDVPTDDAADDELATVKPVYRRAKINAEGTADAMARLLRVLASARLQAGSRRCSVAFHSLGAALLQHATGEPHAAQALRALDNVLLLAPAVDSAGQADWLARVRPAGRVGVTFCRGDTVLSAAQVIDRTGDELGVDPGARRVTDGKVRYIDFTEGPAGVGGHRYFVDAPQGQARLLFERLFTGQPDLAPGEAAGVVYFDCGPGAVTCAMGRRAVAEGAAGA